MIPAAMELFHPQSLNEIKLFLFRSILSLHRYLSFPMTWNRRKRFAILLFALLNLLFMQLAMAAYACPGGLNKGGGTDQSLATAMADLPCAEAMAPVGDAEQPGLCAAHCKADSQSADKYQLPVLATPLVGATDYPLLRAMLAPLDPPAQAFLLTRNTLPSVAVRHCCFRL